LSPGAPLTGPGNRIGVAGGPRRGFSANVELISRTPADAVGGNDSKERFVERK